MKKILEILKWILSFTKKASLRFLVDAKISEEEFELLELAYKTQFKLRIKSSKKNK